MKRATVVGLGLVLELVGAGVMVGQEGHRDQYEAGLSALSEQRWDDARTNFEAAIRAKPKGTTAFRDYLPHYYLGVAWRELGSCRRALEIWAAAERDGAILKSPLDQDRRRGMVACKERLARLDKADATLRQALGQLSAAIVSVRGRREAVQLADADVVLAEAGVDLQALEAAVRELEANRVRALADEQVERLEGWVATVERHVVKLRGVPALLLAAEERVVASVGSAQGALRKEIERAKRALADQRLQAAAPAKAASLRQEISRAEVVAATTDQVAMASAADALSRSVRAFSGGGGPPPAALLAVIEAFLAGEDEVAAVALAGFSPRTPQESAHACLLEAALSYRRALGAVGPGSSAAEDLARVRELAGSCGWKAAGLSLSEKVFPAGFRALMLGEPASP